MKTVSALPLGSDFFQTSPKPSLDRHASGLHQKTFTRDRSSPGSSYG
ncbi:hypothetical protein FOPG_02723 [Fusarium oxysporum f. sp. conglutinans race 2 54008]|uniref:Uncharacterized protein n=6 Tax=Fusarium oxysporum TaxID=5507 RepID=W9IXL3_FUSOX|nr:hypothetical protein FOXG_18242 [Fusarium oxysporum f. sp. lycopersici 4287]EWY98070.1 hypothetical protein FOYG_02733 [Fusarium oxysporum NRRL 32931]EWZ44142.1 hypothetical protein FOZG_05069 [Fusarium oxysporum Fo47]EXK41508.1 hypothetical protein FOMG_04898 [Fusarium oxysporum f. sp. melonis 26406]EXL85349.1 hypothetical protein FOPG_02723 [Fusarium oxysporum f. sp. conglutinans race 2 54008]EXM37132.1 hypothetical protein FOTG_00960 [Fusarium oxysporum f. sp. vasinfectum 25433]KAI84153